MQQECRDWFAYGQRRALQANSAFEAAFVLHVHCYLPLTTAHVQVETFLEHKALNKRAVAVADDAWSQIRVVRTACS